MRNFPDDALCWYFSRQKQVSSITLAARFDLLIILCVCFSFSFFLPSFVVGVVGLKHGNKCGESDCFLLFISKMLYYLVLRSDKLVFFLDIFQSNNPTKFIFYYNYFRSSVDFSLIFGKKPKAKHTEMVLNFSFLHPHTQVIAVIFLWVNLVSAKRTRAEHALKKATVHIKPTKGPKNILEAFKSLPQDDLEFIKQLDKQFNKFGDNVKIKVQKVNQTAATSSKNVKRTIDGSLG